MRPFNNRTTGWTAIAAGICALGVTISLGAVTVIGGYGDVLGTVAAVLIMPVLIAIGSIVMTKHKVLGVSIQILGVLGALIDFIQSILLISGTLAQEQADQWIAVDRGLIGIAILTYALLNRQNPALKRFYVWLSFLLALVMVPPFAVLIIPMLIAIGSIDITQHKAAGRSTQILGVLGALIEVAQYVLVISGIVPGDQAVYAHYVGTGAMAIALLISLFLNSKNPEWRISYLWLGIVFALVIAQNIVGAGGLDEIADQLFQGGSLAQANPVAIILFVILVPLFLLGWPIWLIWTGRLFLKGRLSVPEQKEPVLQPM